MALLQLPRLETRYTAVQLGSSNQQQLEGSSSEEELCGASPTSSSDYSSSDIEFYSGKANQHCARLQQQRPPRRALRWLVRRLHQADRKQQASLPSGGSFDSLSGFSDCSSEAQYDGIVLLPPPAPKQQAQQQQQLEQQLNQSEQTAAAAAEAAAQPAEGGFRRLLRAVLRPVVRFVRTVCSSAGPQGPGSNDNSLAEQIINVVTSIPFFVIGMQGLRRRRCPRGRHFSLAFMAVGIAAAGYHGVNPSSPLRPLLRKMDYYSICYCSNVLRRAAHIGLPAPLRVAALLAAPVKPTAVTGLNLLLVESKYLRSALSHAHLRPSFKLHLGTGLVGMAAFAYEDIANGMRWPPVLHSLWHCLSAVAMGCFGQLLQHQELLLMLEGVQVEACS